MALWDNTTTILGNTLYLTLNAPAANEYHRGVFLTSPSTHDLSAPVSGTLFHATWSDDLKNWSLETKSTKDISKAESLCIMYRLHTFNLSEASNTPLSIVSSILTKIPIGRQARRIAYPEAEEKKGNPDLGGYDCIIWTADALRSLQETGLEGLQGRDVEDLMAWARLLAGPVEARDAVGKAFILKIVNSAEDQTIVDSDSLLVQW